MNTRVKIRTLIFLLFLVFIPVFILGCTTAHSAIGKPKSSKVTTITTELSVSLSSEIQILEQALQGDLEGETRHNVEAKLQILYSEATQQAIHIQHLTSTPRIQNTIIPPTFEFYGQRETGIIQYPSVPFPSTEFRITNAWQEIVNGQYILVFAGTFTSDPEQGVVLVTAESPRRTSQYLTPDKSGEIRIVEAVGFRLIILSKTSRTYYFDVPGERFVSSLEEVVPTITPIPTSTPTAIRPTHTPYP